MLARDVVEVPVRVTEQDWWSSLVEVELESRPPPRPSPERPPSSSPAGGLSDAIAPTTTTSSLIRDTLEGGICLPLQTPLLKKLCLRRSRTPVLTGVLRRSGRLAAKPRAANATVQAQNVLLKKSGVAVEDNAPDADVKAKFRAVLCGNMPDGKRELLQSLMGGIDFSMVELELDGLDEEDL